MRIAILFPNLNANPQMLDVGIAYLATYLNERTKHEVYIIDTTFHKRHWKKFLKEEVLKFKPDVIAVSAMSILFDYAKLMVAEIRQYHDAKIIFGGYQAIMLPEETIQCDWVDAICTGEGEYTIDEYLTTLEQGGDLSQVDGIWYKENGQIIKNKFRPAIHNLDDLPIPDYDLFPDIDKYLFFLQRIYVVGTRGCPYRCSFCAEVALENIFSGKRFREMTPEKYVSEIEYQYEKYKDRGMKTAHLFDTVFSYNDEWFFKWIEEYKKRGLHKKLSYTVFLRPDKHHASDEKIKALAETNCQQVRMGVESGDDEIRKTKLNKSGCTNDLIQDIFEKFNRHGILVKTYSIIGFPHETKQDMQRTIDYNKNPLVQVAFYLSYTPIPGTPMAKRTRQMNTASNSLKYSFHFSRGAKIEGIPSWYVPYMLLKAYIYYGLKLSWITFRANPVTFLPRVLARVLVGFRYGSPFIYTYLYGVINPSFWENMIKVNKRRYNKC